MARIRETQEREVTKTEYNTLEKFTCDKCGKEINPESDQEDFANELIILYNEEQCVNSRFRRDYCTHCLEPIWEAICYVIDANPEDISGSDFHDE